nr:hypothetical protein [uncultured Prevotella sp.]
MSNKEDSNFVKMILQKIILGGGQLVPVDKAHLSVWIERRASFAVDRYEKKYHLGIYGEQRHSTSSEHLDHFDHFDHLKK